PKTSRAKARTKSGRPRGGGVKTKTTAAADLPSEDLDALDGLITQFEDRRKSAAAERQSELASASAKQTKTKKSASGLIRDAREGSVGHEPAQEGRPEAPRPARPKMDFGVKNHVAPGRGKRGRR
ncbi:MAG: hypothetical protein AAF220_09840, partial [Pseudomonadota bacterium]